MAEQHAKRRFGRPDAKPYIGQEAFGKYGAWNSYHCSCHYRAYSVRQNMAEDQYRVLCAKSACRKHIFTILKTIKLRPDKRCRANPIAYNKRHYNGKKAIAKIHDEQRHNNYVRKRLNYFRKAHHHHVRHAAIIASDRAIYYAEPYIG